MNHRILLLLASLLTCVHAAVERPNIVLFLVDDMGVMDTSLPFLTDDHGAPVAHPLNRFYRTPAMESLARQGFRFSRFYANSVCSPTRVSLMTGQSSARHKVTQWINPDEKNSGPQGAKDWNWKGLDTKSVTLPRILGRAGYRTIHCGKGHFGPFDSEGANPQSLGFDVNIAGGAIGQPGSYHGSQSFGHGGKRDRYGVPGLEEYRGKDIFLTEALTLEVNKEIAKAVADKKPFFAYMAHYAVHAPFQADPRFAANYADSTRPAAEKAFATMVEGMDKSLHDVMANLEKLGVAENTLILFLGDNGSDAPLGEPLGYGSSAPLRGKKGTHYEGGMRVPFIAAWAKPSASSEIQKRFPIQAGGVNHAEFGSVPDVLPTLLEVGSCAIPSGYRTDGGSLWSVLAGGKPSNPQTFLMHFPHQHNSSYFTVYVQKNRKLVYHYTSRGGKRYELFDLAADPYEMNNLASSHPAELKSMLEAMRSALDDADARYPVSKDGKTKLRVE